MYEATLKRIFQLDRVADPAASISDARIEVEMKIGPNGAFKNIQLTWEQFLDLVAGTASAPTAEEVFKLFQVGTGVDLHLQDGGIFLNLRSTGDTATPRPTAPKVTGFLPSKGSEGTNVTITGNLFSDVTSVSFNGTPAAFQVINSTTLQAVVPAGATTGPVTVSTAASTGTSAASFTVGASTPGNGDGIARDPFNVPAAKRKSVVDADAPAVTETDESYYGCEFVDEVYGPDRPAYYKCMPSAPAQDGSPTVWRWFRFDVL